MHPLDLSPTANISRLKGYTQQRVAQTNYFRSSRDISHKNTRKTSSKREQDQGKRGRPRADILTTLMVEGSTSRSKIRCIKCGRAFPREKSLQAHMRTHTGEKPYMCDFPGCCKAFCQSGQLKTHQRLHTGEKPFVCIIEGCGSRFTHANRHCAIHPYAGLKRQEMNLSQVAKLNEGQNNTEVKRWIERYVQQCEERGNQKNSNKRSSADESPSPEKTSNVHYTRLNRKTTSKSPPVKLFTASNEKISPLDLTKLKSSTSLPKSTALARHKPMSSQKSQSLQLQVSTITTSPSTSPEQKSTSTTRLSTASSTESLSSSSQLSSPSSSSSSSSLSSSSSITPWYRQPIPHLKSLKPRHDFYPYVFSSQMVLQGSSDYGSSYYSDCFPVPVIQQTETQAMLEQTIPREREKDHYISALALIELSKG